MRKICNLKLHDAIAIALMQLRQIEEACGHSIIITVGEPNAPPPVIEKISLGDGTQRELTTQNIRGILAQYLKSPSIKRPMEEKDKQTEIYKYIQLANQLYQDALRID